jgi:hypothetical protein
VLSRRGLLPDRGRRVPARSSRVTAWRSRASRRLQADVLPPRIVPVEPSGLRAEAARRAGTPSCPPRRSGSQRAAHARRLPAAERDQVPP